MNKNQRIACLLISVVLFSLIMLCLVDYKPKEIIIVEEIGGENEIVIEIVIDKYKKEKLVFLTPDNPVWFTYYYIVTNLSTHQVSRRVYEKTEIGDLFDS